MLLIVIGYIAFVIILFQLTLFAALIKREHRLFHLLNSKTVPLWGFGVVFFASLVFSMVSPHEKSIWPNFFEAFALLSVTAIIILLFFTFLKEVKLICIGSEDTDFPETLEVETKEEEVSEKWANPIRFAKIALVVLVTRAALFIFGYASYILLNNPLIPFGEFLLNSWNVWDAPHYLDIAANGYTTVGDSRFFIVFYPLYPFLIRLANILFHNLTVSAFVVSNTMLIIGCYYLYKLVGMDYDHRASSRAVKYLLIYPFVIFFSIAYTESLFLTLTIMTLYYLRKQDWLIAGIMGLLAALSRNQGILLLVPACYEYLIATDFFEKLRQKQFVIVSKDFFTKGIFLWMIPMGTLLYLVLNKVVTGNWFTFMKYQSEHWSNRFGFFAKNLKNITAMINPANDPLNSTFYIWLPTIISFVLVVGLMYYGIGRIRTSYIAYMLVYLVISFSPTWLISGPRYIMSLAPIYIVLAQLTKDKIPDKLISFICMLAMAFFVQATLLWKIF